MTDLRDAIARAIFLVDYAVIGEESWETAALDGNDDRRQAFEKADAVLAVLRDLPDDVIEQAARSHKPDLWAGDWATASRFVFQTHSESWDAALARARAGQQRDIRAVFAAAFGGEQA